MNRIFSILLVLCMVCGTVTLAFAQDNNTELTLEVSDENVPADIILPDVTDDIQETTPEDITDPVDKFSKSGGKPADPEAVMLNARLWHIQRYSCIRSVHISVHALFLG